MSRAARKSRRKLRLMKLFWGDEEKGVRGERGPREWGWRRGWGAAVPAYPELRHQDVRDAAQDRHEVEDIPGITEVILGKGGRDVGSWIPGYPCTSSPDLGVALQWIPVPRMPGDRSGALVP